MPVFESPKSQAYDVIVAPGAVDPLPSKEQDRPEQDEVKVGDGAGATVTC